MCERVDCFLFPGHVFVPNRNPMKPVRVEGVFGALRFLLGTEEKLKQRFTLIGSDRKRTEPNATAYAGNRPYAVYLHQTFIFLKEYVFACP